MKTTAKETLKDILDAFCLSSQNRDKVIKILNLDSFDLYNGRNTSDQIRDIILQQVTEDEAKEVVNKMPFPFIENYYPDEDKCQNLFKSTANIIDYYKRDSYYWIDNVLADISVHCSIVSNVTGCGIHKKTR